MLNPYQFPLFDLYQNMTEHEHQRELFSWAAAVGIAGFDTANTWAKIHPQTTKRPKLKANGQGTDLLSWLHAIPNGGSRGGNAAQRAREGSRMRSEGVRRGIPDIFLPRPCRGKCGLYIELKKKGGRQGPEQALFAGYAIEQGFAFGLCFGFWEAIDMIMRYVND